MDVYKKILVVVLIIFIVAGLIAIDHGLPLHLVGDEESIVGGALKMMELQNPFPFFNETQFGFLYYPPLIPWIVLLFVIPYAALVLLFSDQVQGIESLKEYLLVNMDHVWLVSRLPALIAGVFLVVVIYKLALVVFRDKPRIAFFAALFMATSFFHFQLSLFVRHWVYGTLFFVFALYFVFRNEKLQMKDVYWAGLFTVLSFGVGTIGFATAVFIGASILFREYEYWKVKSVIRKPIILFSIISLLGLVVFYFLHVGAFQSILLGKETSVRAIKDLGYYLSSFWISVEYLFNFETVLVVFSLIGIWLMGVNSHRKLMLLWVLMIIFYNWMLFAFVHNAPRYHFFIVPLLCLLGAYALEYTYSSIAGRSRVMAIIVVVCVFALPSLGIGRYVYLLSKPTTQQEALRWIHENVKDESFVLNSRSISLVQSKDAVGMQSVYGRIPSVNVALSKVELNTFGMNSYYYVNAHFFSSSDLSMEKMNELLVKLKPRYYITEKANDIEQSSVPDRFFKNRATELEVWGDNNRFNESFNAFGEFGLLNSKMFGIQRFGNPVVVYEVKY